MPEFRKLRPFADVLSNIHSMVEQASDVELTAILREAGQTTGSNCWWAEHQVGQMLVPLIEVEQKMRARRRAQEQEKRQLRARR